MVEIAKAARLHIELPKFYQPPIPTLTFNPAVHGFLIDGRRQHP